VRLAAVVFVAETGDAAQGGGKAANANTVEGRMRTIPNLINALMRRLALLGRGVTSLLRLIALALGAAFGSGGTATERLTNALTTVQSQRLIFDVLRAFLPNLVFSKQFITSYPNSGTASVTRYNDVLDVLSRDGEFEVVYEPRMVEITGGENFFLGMQNTPRYTRDVSNMRIAVRRNDVADFIGPFAARKAAEIVGAAAGRIDVPKDLTLRVPAQLVGEYFGTPGPSEQQMIEWTTILFWYLFIDLTNNASVGAKAREAAGALRSYLDAAVRDRKRAPSERDDILNRCLAMQGAKLPGMDDLGIRNNLIGLIIGAIPTTSKAAVQALDQILDRPQVLDAAQRAARADDDPLLARHVFEALRFNPVNPLIYRRATRDAVIAKGTLRSRNIPKGTMVLAANLSAMFDPLKLDSPNEFRVDRAWDNYILWGYALHTCFGAYINQAMIPAILKPLLKTKGLRRASGKDGLIDTEGTPFPAHLVLEFD
jgi:cytochrome P450